MARRYTRLVPLLGLLLALWSIGALAGSDQVIVDAWPALPGG